MRLPGMPAAVAHLYDARRRRGRVNAFILNIPEPPQINRVALLNQLDAIRRRNAALRSEQMRQMRQKRPGSYFPERGSISESLAADQ